MPGIGAGRFDKLRRDMLGQDEGLAGAWLRDGAPYEGVLARLTRYEGYIERSISRLINEVRLLQADRLRRDAREEAGEAEEKANVEDFRAEDVAEGDVEVFAVGSDGGGGQLGQRRADGDNAESDKRLAHAPGLRDVDGADDGNSSPYREAYDAAHYLRDGPP